MDASTTTVSGVERAGATRASLLDAYRWMLLSRKLDDKEIQLKNQSQIFFQISGAGHEAVLVAAGPRAAARLRLVLPLLPRPRALPRPRRDAVRDAAGGGRREGRPRLGRPADALALGPQARSTSSRSRSPTGTQCLQAVGCAEAGRFYQRLTDIPGPRVAASRRRGRLRLARRRRDRRGRVLGVAEHRLRQAPAGALPGRGQRLRHLGAGRGRRRRAATSRELVAVVPGPARRCVVDGTDFVASAARDAAGRRPTRASGAGPALVHAHVIRPYSHSLSDDERLYKTPAEREAEAARDPIALLRRRLLGDGAGVGRAELRADRAPTSSAR